MLFSLNSTLLYVHNVSLTFTMFRYVFYCKFCNRLFFESAAHLILHLATICQTLGNTALVYEGYFYQTRNQRWTPGGTNVFSEECPIILNHVHIFQGA